jgi:riboflavin synthase alpha subunit
LIYVLRKYLDFAVCVTEEAYKNSTFVKEQDGQKYKFEPDLIIKEVIYIYNKKTQKTGFPLVFRGPS